MDYNKIYYFTYRPVTKIHVFDKKPLVIPLDIGNRIMLGVNLHWIPKKDRTEFLFNVLELFENNKNNKKKKTRLYYEYIKRNTKFKTGLIAIRKYYLNKISSLIAITVDRWKLIPEKYKQGKFREKIIRR